MCPHLTSTCLLPPGCIDGVMGLAAQAASVQVPWLTFEEELIPDLTNHIAGLEALMSDMQLRVKQRERTDRTFRLVRVLLNLSVSFRFRSRSGQWRRLSPPGLKLAAGKTSRTTA